jgi:hypothetical protein
MKAIWWMAYVLTGATVFLLLPITATAQQDEGPILRPKKPPAKTAGATLLVMCDLACDWKLDGKPLGHIEAGDSVTAPLSLGQHVIAATTEDGLDEAKKEIEIKIAGQMNVHLAIQPVRDARLKHEQEATQTWTDPASGLMWTRTNNGTDVDWQGAKDYCRNLQLAGHSDWRLPTIDELSGVFDSSIDIPGRLGAMGTPVTFHVKGNLQLSGWEWSGSQGNAPGEAWAFLFHVGRRHSGSFSLWHRALCVRRSGE